MKKIRHTDILVYDDGVQIFAARDEAGSRYVGVLMDSPDGADRYAVVEVSAARLESVRSESPDLRRLLFEESKDGWYLAQAPRRPYRPVDAPGTERGNHRLTIGR